MVAGGFIIENKTISRKHLIIEVDQVKSGDCVCLSPPQANLNVWLISVTDQAKHSTSNHTRGSQYENRNSSQRYPDQRQEVSP